MYEEVGVVPIGEGVHTKHARRLGYVPVAIR
jgi:hypothetical protein